MWGRHRGAKRKTRREREGRGVQKETVGCGGGEGGVWGSGRGEKGRIGGGRREGKDVG